MTKYDNFFSVLYIPGLIDLKPLSLATHGGLVLGKIKLPSFLLLKSKNLPYLSIIN